MPSLELSRTKAALAQKSLETKPTGTTTISTNLKWDDTVITCWLSLAYAVHKNRAAQVAPPIVQ